MPAKTPSRARVAALVASEKKRTRSGSAVRSVSAGSSRAPSLPATSAILLDAKSASVIDRRAMLHIHRLIQLSSVVYAHALSYNAAQALLAFSKLPKEQQNSAWGLCLLGRICFETGRYPESARAFENGHRLAPYRTRDMDVYSTLLWHMKQEEALAHLAHSMVSIGRSWSPEAWIAVANCFSLDGDHVSALKSIARSMHLYKSSHGGIVVVPRSDSGAVAGLAYAHTLAGHENVASDDLDKAQQAFRTALRINPRHYNAWYGMGMVYLRLGKLDLAEYHFTRALALNPQNPLLLQSAGVLYESRKDYESALKVYERVEKLVTGGYIQPGKGKASDTSDADSLLGDADSAVVIDGEQIVLGNGSHHALNFIMFKRARVLVVLGRFAEAAGALELLQHRCPREFNVPFLLGQTYTKLRRYREAAACLTRALDIAPEYSQSVREAFDALYQQDIDDREASSADSENKGDEYGQAPAAGRRFDGEPSDQTPSNSGSYLYSGGDILSSSSPGAESPYLDSPSLYAGRGGQAEWRRDWRALDSADDRVDRALDFDTV
ncbi:anaphase-promoting complex subunit cdc27 [Dipsacomyces acuminosporus]|nr:anaphase-promoting complex subunit cdc27 [Dipsacomyces acuminosporus]